MRGKIVSILVLMQLLALPALADDFSYQWDQPDWSENSTLPESGHRNNIYNLSDTELARAKSEGFVHALKWPVKVTGMLIPYEPMKYFMEAPKTNPIKKLIEKLAERQMGYDDLDGMFEWLGLYEYPDEDVQDVFHVPYPDGVKPDYRMGASIMDFKQGKMLSFSCSACHFGEVMGKVVPGLTNKRPRANAIFHLAKKYINKVPSRMFKYSTNATEEERLIFKRTQTNIKAIGVVLPQVLGLDTSLPHTALSLARRNQDEYATKNRYYEVFPRRNKLETFVADSKPMPWFTLKYKTRWLSDGSIVAGNPILTNFLWNEVGRGTDLHELEGWMKENLSTIKELTAAVFASRSPRWTDFFPADSIDLDRAKRGEVVFNDSCKKCHGRYEKGWNQPDQDFMTLDEKLETVHVDYPKKTEVKDVGTDPNRWQATEAFADNLNKLAISKWMKTVVVPQEGYVPQPLVGIFARYPYMHNNSIPNLCALMMKPENRPKEFYQGPSKSVDDYDADCVGYPVGNNIPKEWKKEKEAHYVVGGPGMKNTGHSRMFYPIDGKPAMSDEDKRDLLEYLKTL